MKADVLVLSGNAAALYWSMRALMRIEWLDPPIRIEDAEHRAFLETRNLLRSLSSDAAQFPHSPQSIAVKAALESVHKHTFLPPEELVHMLRELATFIMDVEASSTPWDAHRMTNAILECRALYKALRQ